MELMVVASKNSLREGGGNNCAEGDYLTEKTCLTLRICIFPKKREGKEVPGGEKKPL